MTFDDIQDHLVLAAQKLRDAKEAQHHAFVTHAEAKRVLELHAAQKTLEGLNGSNREEREARLRIDLDLEHRALANAENGLATARLDVELAGLEWQLQRYQVRVLVAAAGAS